MESEKSHPPRTRSVFRNISPLDHRYYLANEETFEALSDYLSEEAAVRYLIRVEAALLKAHLSRPGAEGAEYLKDIDTLEERVSPDEVYREEEKTRHNIRALVNVIKRKVPPAVRSLVHAGATSADILDTAQSMRVRDAVRAVALPELRRLLELLIDFTLQEAETLQVGRTHGQHAVPITVGFWSAEYVARLGKSYREIMRLAGDLRGKLSGAVGAYNALTLIVPDPQDFEERFLAHLGLAPSEYSHQLVEPEYLLRLLLEMNTAFGIVANLADDLRSLQRSEIGEIREFFGEDQVGSSTMPQKRNPWNSEHVKSLWKAFCPRAMSFYMDQISEHQRDLTNSASSRFIAEYIAGFTAAVRRMAQVVESLRVDGAMLEKNLGAAGDMALAEAAYILLAESGDPEAHEKIRRLTLACEKSGGSLREEMEKNPPIREGVAKSLARSLGITPEEFFSHPGMYRGQAAEKARALAEKYRGMLKETQETTI